MMDLLAFWVIGAMIGGIFGWCIGMWVFINHGSTGSSNKEKQLLELKYPDISFSYGDVVSHKPSGLVLIVRSIGLYGVVTCVKKRDSNHLNLPEFPWAYPYTELELIITQD